MKKSSFLQNPKDMLSKSFKPAKCKTSLKLAASRIKILKNKKEVQVKQMKRELAQLLESGQDQTARIRVEHVIREEKMMTAYDLIEIYSELIVARLPIIETQKNCPSDLKEAITSVMFASQRCGDIPELLDVRKQFTAKYGKEFTSAAIELRPDSGVSRMLVEKLSAKAPDGQTKIKVLSAIAEEHNIKWDPKSFGENETLPSNDLLNGPSTFEKANKMYDEAPHVVTPDVQAPPSHQMMYNHPLNSSEQNLRSSQRTEILDSAQKIARSRIVSSTSQPEWRPSGAMAERAEVKQSHDGGGNAFSFGHQRWNMDFEDATAAAQAAAESAERASMAARAAAELSSRGITRQYTPEAQKSDSHVLRGEGLGTHVTSRFTNDYIPKESANSYHADRQPRVQNNPVASIEGENEERISESTYQDGNGSGRISAQTASLRSKVSSDNESLFHNLEETDKYQTKSLTKEEVIGAEMSTRKQYADYEADSVNHLQDGFNSQKLDYFGEDRIREQPNIIVSSSHSSISVGDGKYSNSGHQVFGYDSGDNPFVGFDGHIARDTSQPSLHDAASVVFDDSGSDGDDFGFGMSSQLNEESNFAFSSPGRNPPAHLSTDVFETRKSQERSESEVFTKRNSFPESSEILEASMNNSQPDESGPVTFDDSDGPSSESETDVKRSSLFDTKNSSDIHSKENKTLGSANSSLTEMHKENNKKTAFESSENLGCHEAPTSYSIPRIGKSQLRSNDIEGETYFQSKVDEENCLESSQPRISRVHEIKDSVGSSQSHRIQVDDENSGNGKELNFKKLKGGFQHKGHTHPPYMRTQLDKSSSKIVSEESITMIPQSDASPAVERSVSSGESKVFGDTRRSRVPSIHTDLHADDSAKECEKQPVSRGREPYIQNADKNVVAKSSLRGSVTYFDSGSSDPESDSPKQVFTGKGRMGSGVSLRAKASPSSIGSISQPKVRASSGVLVDSDSFAERNTTTSFYGTETPQEVKSQSRRSGLQLPSSAKVASKATRESNISLHEESRKSSRAEQPPSSKQKPDSSKRTESQKISSRSTISRKDSEKKASHVHPNLPDYDTLAARIQALRTDLQ